MQFKKLMLTTTQILLLLLFSTYLHAGQVHTGQAHTKSHRSPPTLKPVPLSPRELNQSSIQIARTISSQQDELMQKIVYHYLKSVIRKFYTWERYQGDNKWEY
jgi:23S rRNA maturation-related 3'-5' exoribonuclease YhaM